MIQHTNVLKNQNRQLMQGVLTRNRVYQSVYYLAAALLYAAILIRSVLLYESTPYLGIVLILLISLLVLFLLVTGFSSRLGKWLHVYLGVQTILVCVLIYEPDFTEYDYFAILFAVLGMQAFQFLKDRAGIAWITSFIVLIAIPFIFYQGALEGFIRTVLFGSVIIFISAYSLAIRRAQEAHLHTQSLLSQLREANLKLEAYSDTLRQLGVANERQRLRRELHDSVTQTIFSMTLTTQSALLLLERDPSRVQDQLERLIQLAQSALEEMHTLISELRPEEHPRSSLVADLRKHLASRQLPEGLKVSIEVEGEQVLSTHEEQGLFRIAQEAFNNIAKHAHPSKACLRMHMAQPFWIEINDDGQGFDTRQVPGSGQLGLVGMHERAEEIGWVLTIDSTPGVGTHVRVVKENSTEARQ